MGSFANPEVLVNTQWVADHLNHPNVRLLEVGWDTSEFESGHIPGAVAGWGFADIQQGDSRDIPDKLKIEAMLSQAGIADKDTVVIYGGLGNLIAVMAFWLLKIYGHRDVRLLDGGRQKWIAEKRPLSVDLPSITPTQYVTQSPNMNLRADRDFITGMLGRADYIFVDARPEDMYRGENTAGMTHGGHIPTAINIPATPIVDATGEFVGWQTPTTNSDGTFKSTDELRALFADKGITQDKNIIIYCVRGGLSTHTWFALRECFLKTLWDTDTTDFTEFRGKNRIKKAPSRGFCEIRVQKRRQQRLKKHSLTQLLGYTNVREYDRSWAEWGNLENAPIEK